MSTSPDKPVMSDDELAAEVLELALLLQQEQASDEERARLERLLADSARARQWYIWIVDDTATLAETAATRDAAGEESLVDDKPAPTRHAAGWISLGGIFRTGQRASPSWTFARLALAASLLIAVLWGTANWLSNRRASSAAAPLARVVSLSDIQWEDGARRYREWSHVRQGDSLRFRSGMLELQFENSVQLVLEGPADFQLVSPKKAIARQGKLVARVGPEGIGFEIETPHAQVTDRGTSFGISISPDEQTDVVVYEGKVDLAVRSDDDGRGARRLESGEGLRVGPRGAVNRIVLVEDSHFVPPPLLGSVTVKRPRIISSVSDNVSLQQTAKYFRIVGGGIQEDCQAYVDRLHQWNGWDGQNIPQFLQSADYVMGFNDDKILPNLQVTVRLSQPANLYVLWDNRVEVPDWLKRGFSDTMHKIGLDEGFLAADAVGEQPLGIGPGDSVDREFSVWRREVRTAGEVQFGPVRSEATSLEPLEVPASMYGIAATPLLGEPISGTGD